MIEPISLLLSGVCLITAVLFVLFPNPLLRISSGLNRTLIVLDQKLMQHRYLVAVLLFIVSYLLFRLALMIPQLSR